MEYILKNVEPKEPLRYFEELSNIPRGSGDEKAVSQYLLDFAASKGLAAKRDELWNVLITKPGQHGGERAKPLALQGHTDMVCEKDAGSTHDFTRDPIKLILEGDMLRADGTTLGADNGVACAIMLALLADAELPHPPLECLFTSQEEVGLQGAAAVDPAWLTARQMINLDCGPEGEITVGCAGGQRTQITRKYTPTPITGDAYAITLKDLNGGHSGGLIHKFQANANKLLGRTFCDLNKLGANLVSIRGGAKDNAIPHEGILVISVPTDMTDAILSRAAELRELFQSEYRETDPNLTLTISKTTASTQIDGASTDAIMNIILFHPNGVKHISEKLGVTVTSLNLGVIATAPDAVTFTAALRSSIPSMIQAMGNKLARLAKLCDAEYTQGNSYPAWSYDVESPLRDRAKALYFSLSGHEMVEHATHGGLECGLFKGKWPHLDVIAIGCNSSGAHSPKESLDLSSYSREYEFVKGLVSGCFL